LEQLDPQKQRRKNIPFIQLVLVFLMKVVGSIKTIDEISDLLLTDELLMSPACGTDCLCGPALRDFSIP
jgi:hypothetical protein